MSTLFVDSYEHYTANNYFTKRKWYQWSGLGSGFGTTADYAKTGSRCEKALGTGAVYNLYKKPSAFANDEVFIQFHLYKGTGPLTSNDVYDIRFRNTSNVVQSILRINNMDYFSIVTGGSEVAVNTDFKLQTGRWHFVQIKFTITNSTVSDDVIVIVDGTEILNPVGIDTADTANTTLQYIYFLGTQNILNFLYRDNMVIMDNQGGVNDDLTATDTFIECKMPNGAGNYSDWTSSGGTNYLMVDETGVEPDDNTTYVETGTAGDRDSYQFENITASSPTIVSVTSTICFWETTAVSRDCKHFTRISSTNYDQVGVCSDPKYAANYHYNQYTWDESPATATAWTSSEVDSAEFGLELNA